MSYSNGTGATGKTLTLQDMEAAVEALRADAERWEHARSIACFTEDRDMGPGGWWTVAVHVKRRPPAAEVQRLRDALKPFAAIDLTTNQAVDAMDVLRARRALEGGE